MFSIEVYDPHNEENDYLFCMDEEGKLYLYLEQDTDEDLDHLPVIFDTIGEASSVLLENKKQVMEAVSNLNLKFEVIAVDGYMYSEDESDS